MDTWLQTLIRLTTHRVTILLSAVNGALRCLDLISQDIDEKQLLQVSLFSRKKTSIVMVLLSCGLHTSQIATFAR